MEKIKNAEVVALERYKIISPILLAIEDNADKGKIGFLKSEACGLAGVSRRTLDLMLFAFGENGTSCRRYLPGSAGLIAMPKKA